LVPEALVQQAKLKIQVLILYLAQSLLTAVALEEVMERLHQQAVQVVVAVQI